MKRFALFVLCATPTPFLLLSSDPVNPSGQTALLFLTLTVAISPLERLFRAGALRYRRQVGLWAAFYSFFHVFYYLDEGGIAKFLSEWTYDYQLIGVVVTLILLALTLTSTRWSQRKLRRRWGKLHSLVYPAVGLALIHGTIATKLGLYTMWPFFVFAVVTFLAKRDDAKLLASAGIVAAFILAAVPEPNTAPPQGATSFGVPACELGPPNQCDIENEPPPLLLDIEEEVVSLSCVNGKELVYYTTGRRDYGEDCQDDLSVYEVLAWDGLSIDAAHTGVHNDNETIEGASAPINN